VQLPSGSPRFGSDGESTAKRIATGLALEPINNIVTEFLPDFLFDFGERCLVGHGCLELIRE